MTRIASFGQQSALLQNTLRNQERLFQTQQQVTTGKIASDFRQLAPTIQETLNLRQVRTNIETFRNTLVNVERTVNIYDTQLSSLTENIQEFKNTLLQSLEAGDTSFVQAELEQVFNFATAALNTQVNGEYIFGGGRTDQPPVTVQSLADLEALTDSADAFANDDTRKRALVADGQEVEFGQLADEVGGGIFASLKRLAEAGPFDGPLTPAQEDAVLLELELLDNGLQTAQAAQAANGLQANRLEGIGAQHDSSEVVVERLISDVEDVDLAEAIKRLNQDQLALQVSYQAISSLSNLSLLNFL